MGPAGRGFAAPAHSMTSGQGPGTRAVSGCPGSVLGLRLWRSVGGFTVGVMLSIGKLAAGQERYYEQQVAQGLDDYFTGRGESPGRWLGRGAAHLGLRGTVEDGELSMLMEGRDPRTGTMLREQPVKVAALDLTFSAPKSISVLHAVADERIAARLVTCH